MAAPIRPDLFSPLPQRAQTAASPGRVAAQRAFFQAALQQATAAQPVSRPPEPQAPAAPVQPPRGAPPADSPLPRLGLHLDIRV